MNFKKSIQINYCEGEKLFESYARLASLAGFKCVSVSFCYMKEQNVERAIEHIGSVLEANSLECVQTHLPYYDLFLSSEIRPDDMEKNLRDSIKISAAIKAPWCVYHPRDSITSGYITSKALEDNKNAVLDYLETAEKYGTGIALENLPLEKPNSFYSANFDDLVELVDSINSDKVGVCWDTGHANLLPFTQSTALKYIGKRLVCTHIHDNFKQLDLHRPVFQGKLDVEDFAYGLADIGYEGPLNLETLSGFTRNKHRPDYLIQSFMEYGRVSLEYIEEVYNKATEKNALSITDLML